MADWKVGAVLFLEVAVVVAVGALVLGRTGIVVPGGVVGESRVIGSGVGDGGTLNAHWTKKVQ